VTDRAVERLREIPLFAELDDDALELIALAVTEFEAAAGHVLVERGRDGAGMFVLEEGSVAVELPGGRTLRRGPGEFFGELALLGSRVRTARVRAETPVRCLAIGRADFTRLLNEEPRIAVAMLPVLARRLAETAAG
jgi:voltage-gated potassium channel